MLALVAAAAVYAYIDSRPTEKRGSAGDEFVASEEPRRRPRPTEPCPTYLFDRQRTHFGRGFRHRPPYREVWRIDGHNLLEFPPAVGYGRVFLSQQRGRFFALDARTGRPRWKKLFRRCMASGPTIGRGLVYQGVMHFLPCAEAQPGATGFMAAWDARSGRTRWRFWAGPIESSPLLVGRTLYFGSWDRSVYAVNARNGRKRWWFRADDEVNTAPAFWRGTVYIASDGGTLYALDARTGRLRWSAQSNARFGAREFFYATPTVAYGRVYIGNTDGTMYVYGARTGRLLWARPLGTYIYAAAAAWRRRIYTGTYDGKLFALDAATGDTIWQKSTPAAVHAAPTLINGVLYFSTCSSCGSAASRYVKHNDRDATFAVDARTGRTLWRFHGGKYANPVVADSKRIYVTGREHLFALTERRARRRRR